MTVQPVTTLPDEVDRISFEVNRFLDFIVESADDLEVDLPEKRFVDLGTDVVHGCPAVVIYNTQASTGTPEAEPGAPGGQFGVHGMEPMWNLTMWCDIIRCAAKMNRDGQVPPAELTAQTAQASRDMAVIMRAVNKRVKDRWGRPTARIQFLSPQGESYATRGIVTVTVH